MEKKMNIGCIFTVKKRNAEDVDLDAKNDVDVDNYVQYIYNTIFI